jgi:hypothetical protein
LGIDSARSSAAEVVRQTLAHRYRLPSKVSTLFTQLETRIREAIAEGVLSTKPHRVRALLKMKAGVVDGKEVTLIEGGVVEDGQDSQDFFYRSDGARISFGITTLETDKGIELYAYRFSIWFGAGKVPPFVRVDLNPPNRVQDPLTAPRSHVHPGSDEILIPTPVVEPVALLEKFLYGIPGI